MVKKIIGAVVVSLLAFGVNFAVKQAPIQAAYRWNKVKYYNHIPFHVKSNSTVYMWNWNHTKRLHNLKNYPRTTWYLSKSVKMSNGKKVGIYYQVTNGKKTVSGFVHRNYLTAGVNPKGPVLLTQNITNEQKQKTRATILKIMNQARPDENLQKVADSINKLNTSDSYEYYKKQLPIDEQSLLIQITSNGGGENDKALNSGKITYAEYLRKNIETQLASNGLSLSSIKGYRIGIGIKRGADILLLPPTK